MSSYSIIRRVAHRAATEELKHSRMLGASWFEAFGDCYHVLDEIFEVIALADPTPVLTRFRTHGPR